MAGRGRHFKTPRDVRQLRNMTMSDEDLTHEIRKKALRQATSALMTRPLTDEEWAQMCEELGLIRSPKRRPLPEESASKE